MIDFEMSPEQQYAVANAHKIAVEIMRPVSRYFDENEGETPEEYIRFMWRRPGAGFNVSGLLVIEEMCWGDAGIWLNNPGSQLGGAAVQASGTVEQRVRFLAPFADGEPKWGAMAMTEPGCGSDTSAIQTTAVRDGHEWVLNGEKIFVTGGKKAAEIPGGFVLVWATVDKSAGRAGMKPFIVEAGTPGMKVEKVEKKLGIRASDTAAISFTDCHIPLDNLIGNPEVKKESRAAVSGTGGFRGAMATFDATRPITAASALGVGR
ncbi:MAG: acyl-CoA dehydrogenase family protein, partial [Dehalococcoidales bacterium]|nr:acyl-CoA dehydrogenase family protein [Dehalococcoidales bacterium]